jgi:hypothetical protein
VPQCTRTTINEKKKKKEFLEYFRESKDVQPCKPTSLNKLSSFRAQVRQTLMGSTLLTHLKKNVAVHVSH